MYPLTIDGHLGRFHPLAVVNNASTNMSVQIFGRAFAFNSLGYLPRSGMVAHTVVLRSFFGGTPIAVCNVFNFSTASSLLVNGWEVLARLSVFAFAVCAPGVLSKKSLQNLTSRSFPPTFSSRSFIVLDLSILS